MLSKKPLKGKVALPLPLSRVQQVFVAFDLGFLFVVASILVGQGKPSLSSILCPALILFDQCSI
jgi:hypothetical protein